MPIARFSLARKLGRTKRSALPATVPVRIIAIERFGAVVPPNRGARGLQISRLIDFGRRFACLPGGQWVCVLKPGID